MQAVVIGIIAVIIGLGIGYATWGSQSAQAEKDVAAAKAKLMQAIAAKAAVAPARDSANAPLKPAGPAISNGEATSKPAPLRTPQHLTLPPPVTAHEVDPPVATEVGPARVLTPTGGELAAVVPSPN